MRLVTRSDFDGLICGFLLRQIGLIDSWIYVHPKDLQDGLFDTSPDDVLCNVPYVDGCGLWFDHHSSEFERHHSEFEGCSRLAPSCARVIYDYYGGADRFPGRTLMIDYTDRIDSGNLTREEILHPNEWILLGFLTDPRTGLGRFRNFTISNYQLMDKLLSECYDYSIAQIMAMPDIQERISLYYEQTNLFTEMIEQYTRIDGHIIITDLRGVETIYTGNRFYIYSLYPEQSISLWIIDGRQKLNVVISCGHSILTRTSKTNVGSLMLEYGGGGHAQVGTCQVPYADADKSIQEIIDRIRKDG
ncbi:MAG: exopolyphosphatase [Symbiobacteriaceae bacterium]|nr:exopolyphosphatase [Symbiobacteriaceae bacterium]